MAKYKSLFNVEGSIGELTFYKGENGYYIRNKGGVSKNRILKDPAFARTRENISEFGSTAKSGKQLRKAISSILADAKDNRTSSRLTQVLAKVKNEDKTSARGLRNVATGLDTEQGKFWLNGFNFNKRANLDSVLQTGYSLETTTGEVTLFDFIPKQQLTIPDGATHVSLSSAFLNLDLKTDTKDLKISPTTNLPLNGISSTITLTPTEPPTGTGINFYFLKVAFFQEINTTQYPLNNGAFNALQIIQIS